MMTTKSARRCLLPLSLVLVALLTSGCRVFFLNPAVSTGGVEADPSPFLGSWLLEEYGGNVPEIPTSVDITVSPEGELGLTIRQAEEETVDTGTLSLVDGATLLSVKNDGGTWHIFEMEHVGEQLVFREPDFAILRGDVSAGRTSGRIEEFDSDTELIEIEADSEALSVYLAEEPSVFQRTFAVLSRS